VNRVFGLIGYPLGHSWSKKYFDKKFHDEKITDACYNLFPLKDAAEIKSLISANPGLMGLNVTIPHKTSVIPLLDTTERIATEVSAVNTIKIARSKSGIKLYGYNTDVFGFETSIKPLLRPHHKSALILGTGGAAKAAAWVFAGLGIDFIFVSRNHSGHNQLGYNELSEHLFEKFTIVVNATPMGMAPENQSFPPLPYRHISTHHLLFDMVYNPATTHFLEKGSDQGATTKNGLEMLHLQAERAWEIWNS
jgi:shikimate dehydrogenase